MRRQGRIANWNDERGFGFIEPSAGGRPVFVHVRGFAERGRRPAGNEMVSYELTTDERGRPRAARVSYVGTAKQPDAKGAPGDFPLWLAGGFLVAVLAAALLDRLQWAVAAIYSIASALAFFLYWWDKSAARGGHRRTPEATLHLIGLIGGWPGALAAQNLLRHKTRKRPFVITFWVTVAINCAALGWLASSPHAAAALGDWLHALA